MTYSLILRTAPQFLSSKSDECTPVRTITSIAEEWTRNTLWNGGCDVGTFVVRGDTNKLASYWQTWLSMDIVELDAGIPTWNGQIQRVELYAGSIGLARDMSLMANRVKALYEDEDGNIRYYPLAYDSWTENEQSIAMYGEKEELLDPETDLSADVVHQVNKTLELYGWPPRYPCTGIGEQDVYLKVYVSGYYHTLNNRTIMPARFGWTRIKDLDDVIDDIIDDSDYINEGFIEANNHAIISDAGDGMKAGDWMDDLLDLTDTAENIYHGWVDARRIWRYEQLDMTPKYFIKRGKVYSDSGAVVEVAPRHVQPGIFRALDFPVGGADTESIFEDRRDILIENISIDSEGTASYQPRQSEINDYMAFMESRRFYLIMTGIAGALEDLDGQMSYTCTE